MRRRNKRRRIYKARARDFMRVFREIFSPHARAMQEAKDQIIANFIEGCKARRRVP